jgi:sulfate transport system substrate-binding protein
MITRLRRGRAVALISLAVAAAVGLSACSSSASGGSGSGGSIAIVAFSVPKPAYDALEAAYKKTPAGKGATFSESYGPSGTQAAAVISGQTADYVALSLEPDMDKLVPKYVASNWNAGPTKGIVSSSIVVICVRKGNPLHITGWDDLTKPGVKIVTADPASSGSAKWNILAAYEHVIAEGGTPAQAQTYLAGFFKNVVSKAESGSAAMTTFSQGTGNVLISYEDEAIDARQAGLPVDYIVPPQTMLIQNPAAITVNASPAAKKFLAYVESPAAQQIFASKGFRPVLSSVTPGTVAGANDPSSPFPMPQKLITIDSLGGWTKVNTEFFDPTNGIVTKIEGT